MTSALSPRDDAAIDVILKAIDYALHYKGSDERNDPKIQVALIPAASTWISRWRELLREMPASAAGPLSSLLADFYCELQRLDRRDRDELREKGERARLNAIDFSCDAEEHRVRAEAAELALADAWKQVERQAEALRNVGEFLARPEGHLERDQVRAAIDAALASSLASSRPTRTGLTVTLYVRPTDDTEITCLRCGKPGCDLEAETKPGPGDRAVIGLHSGCFERYEEV